MYGHKKQLFGGFIMLKIIITGFVIGLLIRVIGGLCGYEFEESGETDDEYRERVRQQEEYDREQSYWSAGFYD